MFNQEEIKRYTRHFQLKEIGLKGQNKLKASKVLVVGAGGLGCPALTYLTAMGIGEIGVLDFDVISHSNLQRQFLFSYEDIGKSKVEVAILKLKVQNPNVIFHEHNTKLTLENANIIFSSYDYILDATDSIPTRYLINDTCVNLGKTFVYGAIHKFEGQVSVFNYKNTGPTYRCIFPENDRNNQVESCLEAGVVGIVPGVIGTIQATEILKIITGIGEVLNGKLFLMNFLDYSTQIIHFTRKI